MPTLHKRVCVCVLGDIGRSPRMQYHSLSLAESGFIVNIVAFLESMPHPKLVSNNRIKISPLPSYQNIIFLPTLVNYVLKVIFQSLCLFGVLITMPRPTHILVQNPPSIPALIIVWFICLIRKCYFVIDWHNYGFSILSLSLGPTHIFVKIYEFLEFFCGQFSHFNFCVSKQMSRDLKNRIGKSAIVLYDKPNSLFKPINSFKDKHEFLFKLQKMFPDKFVTTEDETLFTRINKGVYEMKQNRPVILVSSTSWTEDENFQILLDALIEFDHKYSSEILSEQIETRIVCIITGKGPLKEYYMNKISKSFFRHTKFIFPWLEPEDYPKMLACSDLGICLHMSSSGLDLPMKIVDMFGCGLPVCAYNYQSISELVLKGQNGYLFSDSKTLVTCLNEILKNFPNSNILNDLKVKIGKSNQTSSWKTNWQKYALPVFKIN